MNTLERRLISIGRLVTVEQRRIGLDAVGRPKPGPWRVVQIAPETWRVWVGRRG